MRTARAPAPSTVGNVVPGLPEVQPISSRPRKRSKAVNPDDPTVLAGAGPPVDPDTLRQRAAEVLAGQIELLGELGPGAHGAIALLGRRTREGHLVAVRALPDPRQPGGVAVDVLHRLDESLPELRTTCHGCRNRLLEWSRFCPFCAVDLTGVVVTHSERSRAELLELVRAACQDRYELIGEFRGRDGDGLVYFGRDPGSGEILAMKLRESPGTGDRRSGRDRRGGGTGRSVDRRTRDHPVDVDRRKHGKARYSLDFTTFANPLDPP